MPIHLNYQGTTCKKCGAEFVACQKDYPCPACGQVTEEFFDFIPATIASMKDHKQLYGSYLPESWFSGSVADVVQRVIFEIFDNYEIEKPKDFTAFVLEQMETAEWEEGQECLVAQVEEIVLKIYELYKNDPDFKGDKLKEKPLNPKLGNLNPKTPFPIDEF